MVQFSGSTISCLAAVQNPASAANRMETLDAAWPSFEAACAAADRLTAEFVKRTAFALLWSLSVHDKRAGNEKFIQGLALIDREAGDERNFVKKAVNMALRAIGKRNPVLKAAALAVARRLADSPDPTARWVGKDALKEL